MQLRNPHRQVDATDCDESQPRNDSAPAVRRHRRWLAPMATAAVAMIAVACLTMAMCVAQRASSAGSPQPATDAVAGEPSPNSGDDSANTDAGDAQASAADAKEPGKQARSMTTQELRAQLDALFAGASYALQVTDAKTGDVRYAIDADESRVAASTYKLFIAQDMAAKVEDGSMTWDSPLNGMSLSDCLTTMIVDSDNDCPIAWMETVSSSPQMTANAQNLGATGTDFRLDGIIQTTAADLTVVLRGLYGHTIVSRDSATRIIDLMERQAYRDGIPAGLGEGDGSDAGITVADKVGFLNGTLNDAAIVYSPKGDFTVVILTEGASWDLIAQAAAIVYDAL